MGKNLNPADSYRKAQRKKELKKNKTGRAKARDLAIVKKDTTDLEEAISELESSRADAEKLGELKAELEKINKKKAEYVEEHPEARRLVYRRRKQGEPEPDLPTKKPRNYFGKNGLPRHPERSIYYDPVMNPFGVAPPGMPYAERPLLPGEVDSEAESEDEDIPLPSGLPPGTEKVTSHDDIPMPEGPPPPRHLQDKMPNPLPHFPPPPPLSPMQPTMAHPFMPPAGHFMGSFPPPGFAPSTMPLPPPPFPPPFGGPFLPSWSGAPPPPPGFPIMPNGPLPPTAFPPPPKFFQRQQNDSSIQDPLASIPHQTFQAHQASQRFLANPSSPSTQAKVPLLANPSLPAKPVAAAQMAAATVSAAPELRDLKREATEFIPSAVKRKKVAAPEAKLNAAPSVTPSAEDEKIEDATQVRPDLVNALKNQFGPVPPKILPQLKPEAKTDYDKFLDDMGDILGVK
ncbi:mRNA biogenesis factor-domain-containing protein [Crepidotus variabilis]|uniref:mRNA biogenesis factor-domain-containing protein n=1 Tax=Crepidotus variabilis TaxID=179855 RepID=A0A9P6JWM2_9AGAR|nr:mRNA biogenesis factor-domain-containing protein [Crepidotus variabilis]